MNQQEILNTLTLARLNYFSLQGLLELYHRLGSATAIMEHRDDIRDILPEASGKLVEALHNTDEARRRAEVELAYDSKYGIEPLCLSDNRYPQRLKECADAPLVLFYKGNADLNQRRTVSIVGTRHCTAYGEDMIRRFITDLRELCPKVLVVSGLAYGVDINAHRQALDKGYETVGVLAHGLDDLYPSQHRDTAIQMLQQGGLLTEFFTQTNADKKNFVRRNRIIAGMADATILVESASHGGGLITAKIAQSYNRDVFAFPGRNTDRYSEGCNNLIHSNGATLLTTAASFVKDMGWENDCQLMKAQQRGIERQIFPDLSPEEESIVNVLTRDNDLQINIISMKTGLGIGSLTALLFSLEMKGVLKSYAGGTYHLLS